jgi:hypothetical protein
MEVINMNDELEIYVPTEYQRGCIGQIIKYGLVNIRLMAVNGNGEQVADLADTLHNVAAEMFCGIWDPECFRSQLERYENKYYEEHEKPSRYLQAFDSISWDDKVLLQDKPFTQLDFYQIESCEDSTTNP